MLRSIEALRESLLPWKSNKYYFCVCVCIRAPAYVWVPELVGVCMCVRACSIAKHATRMRHFMTSFVASWSPPYFSTISHKWCDVRKKVIEHKMRVLIFCTTIV